MFMDGKDAPIAIRLAPAALLDLWKSSSDAETAALRE
jgi:hypothetical protein